MLTNTKKATQNCNKRDHHKRETVFVVQKSTNYCSSQNRISLNGMFAW